MGFHKTVEVPDDNDLAFAILRLRLKSYTRKPAPSRAAGNLVVAHYPMITLWVDKNRTETSEALRAAHSWLRGDQGWQIVSAMSMRDLEPGK